jgi:hypothetical protein
MAQGHIFLSISYVTCYVGQVVGYDRVDLSHQFRLK